MNAARLLFALLPVAAVAFGAVRWAEAPPAAGGPELRVGVAPGQPRFDFRLTRFSPPGGVWLGVALWEPLLAADSEVRTVRPAAAESWEVLADGRRMILRLHPAGRWSTGEPVTAHDFVRSAHASLARGQPHPLIDRLVGAREHLIGEGRLEEIGIRALDDLRLELEFRQAPGDPAGVVAEIPFVPLHPRSLPAVMGPDRSDVLPVTNGPFAVSSRSTKEVVLQRNPHHRHAERVELDRVRLIYTEAQSLLRPLFTAGRIDLTTPMFDLAHVEPERLPADVRLHEESSGNLSLLHFNVSRAPLNDVRVRRALSLALDRQELARRFQGRQARAAWSLMAAADASAETATVEEDLAEARRLLAEAGYPDGRGFPILRAPIVESGESSPLLYFCADQWRKRLGIRVYVAPLPSPEVRARSSRGEFDMIHYFWTLSPTMGSAVSQQISMRVAPGFGDWDQREVAALVQQAWRQTGEERARQMLVAERALVQQMPLTPLISYRKFVLKHDRVTGWRHNRYGAPPLAELGVAPAMAESFP